MPTDHIRYDLLVQEALRSVVRKVLGDAARNGLPGEHHFYISFKTGAPGVTIPAAMRQKYPDEMTIILQHEFWDLSVNAEGFEVSLSIFRGSPNGSSFPFAAITGFSDPSVPTFGFKFMVPDRSPEAGQARLRRRWRESGRGKGEERAGIASQNADAGPRATATKATYPPPSAEPPPHFRRRRKGRRKRPRRPRLCRSTPFARSNAAAELWAKSSIFAERKSAAPPGRLKSKPRQTAWLSASPKTRKARRKPSAP